METTVEGEGTLTFWWNHSSASGDYLSFYIDGRYQTSHSGGWQQKSYNIVGLGSHTLKWKYYKDASGSSGSDCGWVDYVQWTPASNQPVQDLANALDTSLAILTGGHADWSWTSYPVYYDGDSARSGTLGDNQFSEMQTTVSGSGTLTFYWKVSSEENYDWLEFYLDGVRQDRISGEVAWTQKSISITGSGNHTLLWRYIKDGSTAGNDDRAYVDYLQWSGAGPIANPPAWQTVSYTYDPAGRRIEKKVDGATEVKYVYDGDHIIAEYDGSNSLLRKYIHGPGIDQPICMIESSGGYVGTYYYHFDALGSVVGLTNSAGNMVELYEYSVYGQVAASDADHPNRFMFTGREFDKDTGLYCYRARYYHPEVGRFLQTDPVGYDAGANLYRYCRNNPIRMLDPMGLTPTTWPAYDPCAPLYPPYPGGSDPCDPCEAIVCIWDCNDPCNLAGDGFGDLQCTGFKPGHPMNPVPIHADKLKRAIEIAAGEKGGLSNEEPCGLFDALVRALRELIRAGKGASTTVIIIFDCPQFQMLCPSPSTGRRPGVI